MRILRTANSFTSKNMAFSPGALRERPLYGPSTRCQENREIASLPRRESGTQGSWCRSQRRAQQTILKPSPCLARTNTTRLRSPTFPQGEVRMSSSLNCIDVKASRREFLKASGLALGAAAVPAWVLELEAAEAEAVDKGKLADAALSAARTLRASYADIRINRYRNENTFTREKQVQQVSRTQSFGCGVRVLLKGTWGFASSRKVTAEEVRRITLQAIEIAQANAAYQRKPFTLAPVTKVATSWRSNFEKDPFDIPLEDKIGFLLKRSEEHTSELQSRLHLVCRLLLEKKK